METCTGQVLLDLIQRCNETPGICDKLRIDTHDVRFETHGGITVTFLGHHLDEDKRFRLGLFIQPVGVGHISENVLYEDMIYELQQLIRKD